MQLKHEMLRFQLMSREEVGWLPQLPPSFMRSLKQTHNKSSMNTLKHMATDLLDRKTSERRVGKEESPNPAADGIDNEEGAPLEMQVVFQILSKLKNCAHQSQPGF